MRKAYSEYKGFKVRDRNGLCLILESDKINESIEFMRKEEIKQLEINLQLGYNENNVLCLEKFNFIERLNILHWKIMDISSIHSLTNLQTLIIQTYCKTKIDFTVFPKLKTLRMDWRSNSPTLYELDNLQELWLHHFKPKTKDLVLLKNLKNLKNLRIANSPIHNLNGIENFQGLKKLELYYLRPLQSLDGVQHLKKLEELRIEACSKVNDIEQLSNLIQIKKIAIDRIGAIPSIKPLNKLKNLEFLYNNTNIIDGDITHLFGLKKLKKLLLVAKKHYSHTKQEALQKILL